MNPRNRLPFVRRFSRLLLVLGVLATGASASHADTASELDLIGTWHVLIHYTDDHTNKPDQIRWDDKIWVFKHSGSRLRWTKYPIVVFQDQTGRFENSGGNRASRVLHGWKPNEAQLAQIRSGLEVNPRGSKSKTLRGSSREGWHSASSARTVGASIVTYQENWIIEGTPGKPIFRREETLSLENDDTLDGVTIYTTTEVLDNGNVLQGTFERDGTRHGTFRLARAGAVETVKGSGKSQSERVKEVGQENWDRMEQSARRTETSKGPSAEPSTEDQTADEQAMRESGWKPTLPSKGMTLEETLAALHAPPGGYYSSLLRKLEILLLRPDGFDVIPYADIKSGAFEPSEGDDYGVLALVFCKTALHQKEYSSWYLLDANSLSAWNHFRYHDNCASSNLYEPAARERVALETQITLRVRDAFPIQREHDLDLYNRGLALVKVGRIKDAERMLTEGDKGLDREVAELKSSHAAIRSRLANRSDRDSARARLISAIEAAKRVEDAGPERTASD